MRLRPYLTDPLARAAFAIGLLASFLYCRHLGAYYAVNQPFTQMVRTPQAINPTTGCFPTFEQMMAMCKARAGRDKIIVVVGGNSVLLGLRQPLEDLWSTHLQEQLGDGYAVVNLAGRGQTAIGGAGSVAEALLKEGRRVIYVTGTTLPDVGPPDNIPPYKYLYWSADARGLLFPYPARDRDLASADATADRSELILRARFDRLANAEALWNTLSYTSFSTVWDVVPYNKFYRPRSESQDFEPPSPPVPQRFETSLARNLEHFANVLAEVRQVATPAEFERHVETGFVPQIRPNTLVAITAFCPYYIRRAPPDQQAFYAESLRRAVDTLRRAGIASFEIGTEFDDVDFGDFVHLDPSGGRKLADRVTPEVRRIAHALYGI